MLSNQDKKEMLEMIAECVAGTNYAIQETPWTRKLLDLLRDTASSLPQDKPERKMPEYELKNNLCVNSKWPARWLVRAGGEYCQCSFDCKVRVVHKSSGYEFVVTETELNKILASTKN